jgi:hypothetical protein
MQDAVYILSAYLIHTTWLVSIVTCTTMVNNVVA